jgi:amino acid adenylation domain-containing protein
MNGDRPAPLSYAQRRLWFLQELFPQNVAYNVPLAYRLEGRLDVGCLRAALDAIVRRHHVLRTVFEVDGGGEPVQVPCQPEPLPLPLTSLEEGDPGARLDCLHAVARERARRAFDLRRGPLINAELFRLGAEDHVLLLVLHHVAIDQWSVDVLLRELRVLYGASLRGAPSPLPDLPVQYADFAAGQRARMEAGLRHQLLPYWLGRLDGAEPLALPMDRPRPPVQAFEGALCRARVPNSSMARLTRLATARGATPFMALTAAFAALLSRYTGQADVVLGAAIANRTRPELERLIGFFVNTLALRIDLSGDPPFIQLLDRVRETTAGAYDHQDLPFETLVETLSPTRDLSGTPLINVVLSYLNTPGDQLRLPGVAVSEVVIDPGIAQLDLDVSFRERGGSLDVEVAYRTDLFDATTVDRLLTHLVRLLVAAADDPAARISELPLLGPEERRALLTWGERDAPPPPGEPLHRLFERRAAAEPEAIAIAGPTGEMRYGELNRRANRLAHRLRALGVGPETLVGVCARRSPEAAVGMLGVLKAGGAYLPLDPEHPRQRLALALEDARPAVLLAHRDVLADLPPHPSVLALEDEHEGHPDGDPEAATGPRHLAYVIFTSGSTGRPKGVAIEQAGLVGLCAWTERRMGLRPHEAIAWTTSPAFDVSGWELWSGLLAGARVEILERALLEPEGLRDWLLERQVGVALLMAGQVEGLLPLDWPGTGRLRVVSSGGDRLRLRPPAGLPFELLNDYGPTEATVASSVGPVAPDGTDLPAIGGPLWYRRLSVRDAGLDMVPEGAAGELCIGGLGVARGYLGAPGPTAERFVPDPDGEPGARMYRTGDLARWRRGELEFIGRADQQVKIRGYRVELGEVEAILRAQPGVAGAAAALVQAAGGRSWLVGYVVPRPGAEPDLETLRSSLARQLPGHMVPQHLVHLEALPLTATGKLDRRRLPALDLAATERFVAPRDELESAIARLWAGVLGLERVGVRDNFFDLGGHSLLATRLTAAIRRELGVRISPRALFDNPTVESLAARVLSPALAPGSGR